MSWLIRLGIPAALLVAGYFALDFIARQWVWFASLAAIAAATALCSWILFGRNWRSAGEYDLGTREREEIMQDLDTLPVPQFDQAVGGLLTDLDAKHVKRFGHKGSDLGCNFVVTLVDGKRVLVRAKKDDGTMRRMGERHLKALGWEAKPRWKCDFAVLVTSGDLHWMNYGLRNDSLARHLGITLVDRKRLATWLDSGSPPAVLRPNVPKQLTSQAA
ncbi:restriction endonuclease [Salininema proteolyticum]|uniref:Restriction endonuclease n=1 Tax=Salininema proteolyticum TaxID=1607685 RepID=A0ABV8TYD2_9ACTN